MHRRKRNAPRLGLALGLSLIILSGCKGLKIESCIYMPEDDGAYCYDERLEGDAREYFRPNADLDQYFMTNPEDFAELLKRCKK